MGAYQLWTLKRCWTFIGIFKLFMIRYHEYENAALRKRTQEYKKILNIYIAQNKKRYAEKKKCE